MGKVIPLKNPPASVDVVKELERGVIDETVTEAVLVYRVKPVNENDRGQIRRYWFGEDSTIMGLGLARHMCGVIEDYIREESWDLDDDGEMIDDN